MATIIKKVISAGFPIEIPQTQKAEPCVFRIYFGRKYLIWKGKSLRQSIDLIGKSINARLRDGNPDNTNFMYHLVQHIKKNGITKGFCKIEDVFTDYVREESGTVKGYQMLVDEQKMIDKAIKDSMCLNNNVQAYVPENNSYITNADKEKFLRWYEKTHKK